MKQYQFDFASLFFPIRHHSSTKLAKFFPIHLFSFPGGLGSYTPSKIQMNDAPFQLGVSRTPASENGGNGGGSTNHSSNGHKDKVEKAPNSNDDGKKDFLRPIEDATSWSGSSSSSDMLF